MKKIITKIRATKIGWDADLKNESKKYKKHKVKMQLG